MSAICDQLFNLCHSAAPTNFTQLCFAAVVVFIRGLKTTGLIFVSGNSDYGTKRMTYASASLCIVADSDSRPSPHFPNVLMLPPAYPCYGLPVAPVTFLFPCAPAYRWGQGPPCHACCTVCAPPSESDEPTAHDDLCAGHFRYIL
ncbi:hypothetical protein K503DRAFT_766950 [Rhizopogon vinicolor AM-OR11-026]|uniref:Uncharacterized protein n=1 Tax=Rhizopogon vinicolor AM-OR11-026 TaxID=1314800 RepID=A0A1B7NBF4_9AGAM|nr:hypothetical protein K503DRAFT_766950 [Rhizopogon vinicolor AM-OR11-026]